MEALQKIPKIYPTKPPGLVVSTPQEATQESPRLREKVTSIIALCYSLSPWLAWLGCRAWPFANCHFGEVMRRKR